MATYLIDYENVSKDGLNGVTRLTEEDRVIIFYSERADRMTFGLHRRLNETKAVIEYKKVDVGGRNALDFQLATYLGYLMAQTPEEEYCVVSNDRGFEYLVGFWRKPLYNVTLTRAIATSPQAEERRQARRNAQLAQKEAEERMRQDEAGGATTAQEGVSVDAEQTDSTAVVTVEKKPLVLVPDAKSRQLTIVPDAAASEPEEAEEAAAKDAPQEPDETAAPSAQAVAEAEAGTETTEDDASTETEKVPEPALPEETASREVESGDSSSEKDETPVEPVRPFARAEVLEPDAFEEDAADEDAPTEEKPETQSKSKNDTSPEKKGSSKSSGRSRSRGNKSGSRKKTVPFLADVKNLLGGHDLAEKEQEEIAGYVEKYKTKQGVNNALVRKFGNQKGGELYQGIKPLLKDKKGRGEPKKN